MYSVSQVYIISQMYRFSQMCIPFRMVPLGVYLCFFWNPVTIKSNDFFLPYPSERNDDNEHASPHVSHLDQYYLYALCINISLKTQNSLN